MPPGYHEEERLPEKIHSRTHSGVRTCVHPLCFWSLNVALYFPLDLLIGIRDCSLMGHELTGIQHMEM